jgi:hypothetical protein
MNFLLSWVDWILRSKIGQSNDCEGQGREALLKGKALYG